MGKLKKMSWKLLEAVRTRTYVPLKALYVPKTYLGLLGMPVTAPLMPLVPYSFIPKAYM